MNLTVKDLEEKIKKVEEDLKSMSDIRAVDTLNFYKEYLEDELRLAEQNERLNGNS